MKNKLVATKMTLSSLEERYLENSNFSGHNRSEAWYLRLFALNFLLYNYEWGYLEIKLNPCSWKDCSRTPLYAAVRPPYGPRGWSEV